MNDFANKHATPHRPVVACVATQGNGSLDEQRIVALLERLEPRVLRFDRGDRRGSARMLFRSLLRERPDLVIMEGTGLAGGLAVMGARLLGRIPYVVSSGDAIGPFWRLRATALGPVGWAYERFLYRLASGFIGWTPYLAGRALTLGAPRAITAENWAPTAPLGDRVAARARLGIPDDAIVFGIVGSLAWNPRAGYCYGLELVRAVARSRREDVVALVVGDGDGRPHLEAAAGELLGTRVLLPGRVTRDDVPSMLAAMDVASLPQSVDGVGSFRYTTKLSDYLAAGLPVVTGRIPAAYDLDDGWVWRLPGKVPWGDTYIDALASLMETMTVEDVRHRRESVPHAPATFSRERQQRRVVAFVEEILDDRRTRGG